MVSIFERFSSETKTAIAAIGIALSAQGCMMPAGNGPNDEDSKDPTVEPAAPSNTTKPTPSTAPTQEEPETPTPTTTTPKPAVEEPTGPNPAASPITGEEHWGEKTGIWVEKANNGQGAYKNSDGPYVSIPLNEDFSGNTVIPRTISTVNGTPIMGREMRIEAYDDPSATIILDASTIQSGDHITIKNHAIIDGDITADWAVIKVEGSVMTFGDIKGHDSTVIATDSDQQNILFGGVLGKGSELNRSYSLDGGDSEMHIGKCYDGDEVDTKHEAEAYLCKDIDPVGVHSVTNSPLKSELPPRPASSGRSR